MLLKAEQSLTADMFELNCSGGGFKEKSIKDKGSEHNNTRKQIRICV